MLQKAQFPQDGPIRKFAKLSVYEIERFVSSAGIATTSDDQSTAWRDPHFVLPPNRVARRCKRVTAIPMVLPAITNGSTQHERNTAFPASFASNLDTDTSLIAVHSQGSRMIQTRSV
jgi:hypothetical protein